MYNNTNSVFEYTETFKYIDNSIMNGIPFKRYSISNFGRVYDNYLKEFPSLGCDENGYLFAPLYITGQIVKFPIHELVGHYFVPKYKFTKILRHIDGNIKNNFFMNLEWVYNINNLTGLDILLEPDNSKVTRKDVELICMLLNERLMTQGDIAIASGIVGKVSEPAQYISRIYCGKQWKDVSRNYNFNINERYRKKKDT